MAVVTAVLELLARLAATPVRRGGILDIPFHEYAEDIVAPDVVQLLGAYVRSQPRPTLRSVVADPRFRRWVELAARSPLRKKLEHELELVSAAVVEEEHILEDDPVAPTPAAAPPLPPPPASLSAWAEQLGVEARLRDPAGAIMQRVPAGELRSVLRNSRRATIGDLLDGTFDTSSWRLGPRDRELLAHHAKAYVLAAGERELADRREAQRIAALGHVLAGEGALDFLAAVDAALARITKPSSQGLTIADVSLERAPMRIAVRASALPDRDGRPRTLTLALVLDDWRLSPLETLIQSNAKDGRTADAARLVLGCVRRVLGDPRHPMHAALVGHLDEPPWTRVLANLDASVANRVERSAASVIVAGWMVTTGQTTSVVPLVRDARAVHGESVRSSSADLIVHGHVGGASALDEAVARALWVPQPAYSYPYASGARTLGLADARARTFHALSLLVGHDEVRGRGGVPLQVIAGTIDVALEQEGSGYRFVFDIAGVRLGARELRDGLDVAGYLVHVDLARGVVLLAHAGAQRASVLAALASEAAVFPASSSAALVERVIGLGDVVPIALPAPLAGEPVDADARPLVRVVRESVASLSLSWLVRPIAGGPAFAPGAGPTQLLQQVGGRRVFAERSFEDERRRVDTLRARLPAPVATGPLAGTRCEGIEAVLAVIAELRAAAESGEAVVEWPKSLPRVIGDASWSKLRLRVTAQRDWFGLNGGVEVDGMTVSLADLLAARRHGDRFLVVGPDKLVALEDELRAKLADLDALARPSKSGLTFVKAAVPALTELLDAREQLDAAPAFWSLLARIDAAAASAPRVPRGFTKVLRSYQLDGFRWMSRLAAWDAGACLADEMGLGKTVQTLALLVSRSKEGPALVVAPTSVGPNWIHEAKRFAPSLNPILHRGPGRAAALSKLSPGDLLVTSYDVLARDERELAKITFSTLVLDEAQAIKNGGTSRARAARSLRADFRLALTGTPVENRLSELFSVMEFLNPGFFGSEADFRARYVIPIERDKDASRSSALARVVRPFLLRRKKANVLSELPARTEIMRAVERSPAERALYEATRQLAIAALSGADEDARFQVLAEIMRLRRLACHPRLDDERSTVASSKLDAFLELVAELREGGHRALVFSQFTGHLALVEEALRARAVPYLYLDGKTPVPERTKRVAAFQAGEGDLFLISLKAGGTGLNLTAADTVIHLDPWWNPAVEDQATDRAHRIGQTRPVTVIRLIAQGTIEEAVMALHDEKRQLAESILEGSAASGKLSVAELGALIREGAAEEVISR